MNTKRPTSRDVAREAGVSVATVSRTITRPEDVNAETREHVLDVMQRMGYRANRAAADLRRGSSKTLLVLVSDITNAFFAEFFKGIEEEARQHGYVVLIGDTSEVASTERVYSNMLLMNQAGGLILNTYDFPMDLMPNQGDGSYNGPPLVSCAGHKDVDVPSVRTDDALGGRLAAEHLIGMGHTDIIQICGPLQVHGFERRFFGFRQALKRAGIDIQEDRIISGQLSVQFGIDTAQKLVDEGNLPSAVFIHNDETATGFLHGLANNGVRVPEDISVVGYDDMPYAAVFNPGLTTIHLPRRLWGRLACRKLVAVLEGEPGSQEPVIIPPSLVVRGSTCFREDR